MLLEGGLVTVIRHGRRRYYRISGPEGGRSSWRGRASGHDGIFGLSPESLAA